MERLLIGLVSSVVAIIAGGPALYYSVVLYRRNKSVARLSILLFLTLLAHSIYHLFYALNDVFWAASMNVITSVVLFLYALYYWKLFRSDQG